MTRTDYEAGAKAYARHPLPNPEVLAALAQGGAVDGQSRVLEVGCGTGNHIIALTADFACEAHGLEPANEMRAVAQSRDDAMIFHAGSAENLAAVGDSFDFIFTVEVIHHMTYRDAYFAGSARALKPGGRLATVTDSEDIMRGRMPLVENFPETVAVELDRYPSIATLRADMTTAGFTAISKQGVSHAYDPTDATAYRDRAFSSLHLIDHTAFESGLARLKADLAMGPLSCTSRYTLLWGTTN
ncbi:MAG: class I SAM-dependent methyltransferase [Alphaproteobacteria bacterium]